MRFTMELGNDTLQTGAELGDLLVRIAPTVERCVGAHLKDYIGSVRDLNDRKIGSWEFTGLKHLTEPVSEPARTSTKQRPTAKEINNHLLFGPCYVNIESERIRIRRARTIDGQLQGRLLNGPGEWIPIPPDATLELLD